MGGGREEEVAECQWDALEERLDQPWLALKVGEALSQGMEAGSRAKGSKKMAP